MAGQVIRIIPITKFTQGAGATTTQRVAQHIDVSQWASAEIMTRVHAGGTQNETFDVKVYADGFTTEDPGVDFKDTTALADVDLSAGSAGTYDVTALSGAMGAMLIVEVVMTTVNNAIDMDISIDLSLKDA